MNPQKVKTNSWKKIEAKCKKHASYKKNTFKFLLLGSNGLLGNELKKNITRKKTLCLSKKCGLKY